MGSLIYNGTAIRDRDEMLCLTDMWRAAGSPGSRKPSHWLATAPVMLFLDYIADTYGKGNPDCLFCKTLGRNGATWAHWQVGLAYAKHLNPEFHAWCNTIVRAHMEGVPPGIDPHILDAILAPFKAAIAKLNDRIDGLMLAGDPRLHAVPDRMTVREALDRAGATPKGRRSLHRRVSIALQFLACERGIACPAMPHVVSKTLLFPAELVNEFMATTGHYWVAEHNDMVGRQGVLPFPKVPARPEPRPGA
jgi:hypothetical protein